MQPSLRLSHGWLRRDHGLLFTFIATSRPRRFLLAPQTKRPTECWPFCHLRNFVISASVISLPRADATRATAKHQTATPPPHPAKAASVRADSSRGAVHRAATG